MRFVKEGSFTAFGRRFGVSVSPGWLSIGVWWETAPIAFALALPFLRLWLEHGAHEGSKGSWRWGWSLARLIIWKTEFRLDIDLNDWTMGLARSEFDDFSVHFGPFNVQIETNKFFAENWFPGVPTLRLFCAPGHSVMPWPPRCRCSPPRDHSQCEDVTDFPDNPAPGRIPKDSHGQK
jgi:hypothetical protein